MSKRTILGGLGVALVVCLTAADTPKDKKTPPAGKAVTETDSPFKAQLLGIARNYRSFGRIDDEMRWAPWLCRVPNPGMAYVSASKDKDTHGQKLYSLFAKHRDYENLSDKHKTVLVGQVIVKESWAPREIKDPAKEKLEVIVREQGDKSLGAALSMQADHFLPYARKDGKLYKADKKADLFIMMKLDPKTANTDNGWVYGTVSADGKTVTAAGKIESCINCHKDAPYDRLFGMQPRKDPREK